LSVNDDSQRAVIHYQIGQLEEKAGQRDAAIKEFEKAIQANATFYEAHECLVNISLAQKDWAQLMTRLENFSAQVSDDTLRSQLSEVCVRLREGLERGSSTSV